jgi:uncharacterized protein (TIGR00369 family)
MPASTAIGEGAPHGERLPLHVIRCPPDELFQIDHARREGEVVHASMPLGPRSKEADGVMSLGSLGVLVDSVLGYANMITTPGRWSVTTGMTLDAFPALQAAGDRVRAEGEVVQADAFSGFAAGHVRAMDGTLVALCTQRLRFLPGLPPPEMARPGSPTADQLGRSRPADFLGDETQGSDHHVRFEVVPALQNPLRNLHGGMSAYACDRAVARALRSTASPFVTTSLQVSFLRPIAGGEWVEFRPTVVHRGRTLAVVDVVGAAVGGRAAIVARASAQPLVA